MYIYQCSIFYYCFKFYFCFRNYWVKLYFFLCFLTTTFLVLGTKRLNCPSHINFMKNLNWISKLFFISTVAVVAIHIHEISSIYSKQSVYTWEYKYRVIDTGFHLGCLIIRLMLCTFPLQVASTRCLLFLLYTRISYFNCGHVK